MRLFFLFQIPIKLIIKINIIWKVFFEQITVTTVTIYLMCLMNRNLKLSQLFISFPQKEAPAILTAFDVKRARWLIMAILKTVLISFRRRRRKKKFNVQFFVKIWSVYKLRYLVPDAVVCTYIYMCMWKELHG